MSAVATEIENFLIPRSLSDVRRYVVLDAPNLMHMKKSSKHDKFGVTALLAIMKYFLKNDFDVIAVSQRKYSLSATVYNECIFWQLEETGLIYMAQNHVHDDIVALEIAYATDGVIVSNDQFRDHLLFCPRLKNIINRCISINFTNRGKPEQSAISEAIYGCNEQNFSFIPRRDSSSLYVQLVFCTDSFFSTENNIRHEIVKEHRQNWTVEYRDKTIGLIDDIIKTIRSNESPILKAESSA
ncbi:hypothetical protein DICVIV_05554 [Dictyocaulus viviparus]|uniref:RNase NYN domain-containing protein n=1 Tax=Dictyocaulus viviparus TaxID=29172 RepID=A0A0D8XUN1_DICVI|nr:hypothetical protein DICVIV_05554 [Dictyocaulus viviparus]